MPAAIAAVTVAAGIATAPVGTASAAAKNAPSVALRTVAKPPPCKRCCLKMNKKTHRCAKYGYHRGKGKCAAKCK
jgi:hypothetical protein